MHVFFPSSIIVALGVFILLFKNPDCNLYHVSFRKHSLWMIGWGVLLIGIISGTLTTTRIDYTSTFYDIYTVTTPYGFFSTSGELHGSGGLFFSHVDGKIQGAEYYSVKYYGGNSIILTKILDAQLTPLILDDTYQLEVVHAVKMRRHLIFDAESEDGSFMMYKIHIFEQSGGES